MSPVWFDWLVGGCFHLSIAPPPSEKKATAAASSAASMPAVSSGADIDTDELVDETGVEPKDIELIMSQVSMQQQQHKQDPSPARESQQTRPTQPYHLLSCLVLSCLV